MSSFVCGAYKGYIGSTDELVISVNVDGNNSGFSAGTQKAFSRSSSNWIEFAIPMNAYPGNTIPESANVGINARIMQRGSLMNWGKSPFTEIWLDSFHFCDPVQLTAYAPEVIAGNTTTKIHDREEESKGVQTFVNLDNDDEDGEYDHKDTDGVIGDNELVRLRLELPMNSFGKVEFKADKVGDTIQLWDDAGKKNRFELYNDEVEVEQLLRANADGSKFIRDIWVEALKPSASPKDQVFTFIFKNRLNNDEKTEDKIVLTALALESIEWVGQKKPDGGIEIFQLDPLAPSWAKRPVKRVFPGKQWVDHKPENSPRDIVKMRANLNVKPVRPVNIYFRQIDVDDPSTNDDEVDLEDSADDNRSEKDEWGFVGPTHEYAEIEFDDIEKEVEFRVPMQPGDNFLIVGGGDLETLKKLENDDQKLALEDEALGFLVHDPDVLDSKSDLAEAEIPRAEQSTSEVVTTWRMLHLEVDKMEPVKSNRVKGEFVSFRHRGTREINGSDWFITDVKINKTLYLELPEEARTGEAGLVNSFANGGRLKIGGWGTDAQVIENTAQSGGFDVITIATPGQRDFGTQDENQPIELWDDDLYTNDGDTWPDLSFDLLEEEMKKVYIEVDKTTVDNPRTTQPFLINAGGDEPYYLKSLFRKSIDNVDYSDDPDFWYAFILDAYQGSLFEDGDGTFGGAIAGQTDANNAGKGGRGAVFYFESGRELARDHPSVGYSRDASVVHEVGHLFGGVHSHPGVMLYTTNAIGQANMTPRSQRYAPITQDAIRSTINP